MFSGTIQSDFLKIPALNDRQKTDLIDFAATDFITFRDALVNYVKAAYPMDYQNFSESDLGMMLIELVSYMGAVMSLKADMLANENYLPTARSRNNVKKLLELIGVRMKGPIGAVANAELNLDEASEDETITINPEDRTVTTISPEDGGPLNFTIYKIVNGALDNPRPDGSVSLNVGESDNNTSSVWTNISILEGSLAVQTGTFLGSESIKKIPLTASPVIEGSVEVYINSEDLTVSGAWTRVDNLYFASGAQNIFEVQYNDNYEATVIFGDGRIGNIAPAGATYSVFYRVGGGSRGNLRTEVINTSVSLTNGNAGTVQNTSMATGGKDAETVEHAKEYAPLTFKRQDRLVTVGDYSTFANTFTSITGSTGKARAAVREAYSSANIIDLYLLQIASNTQLQQATVAFKKELLDAMEEKKMITDEVIIVDGLIRTLDLIVSIRIDKKLLPKEEEIKGKVRRKIQTFFNVDNVDFGKSLILADLSREIFSVPEVRYSTVDNLLDDVHVDFNEIIQLNNFVINVVGV